MQGRVALAKALTPALSRGERETARAAELRQHQTDVERLVWFAVRDRRLCGAKFRRQAPLGRYIVDFLCLEAKLVVELDGGQHDAERDQARDEWLAKQGYRVLRFWNHDVIQNSDGVLTAIAAHLDGSSPCGRGQGEGPSE